MEETDICSLPGGLSSIRRHFESEETSATHTVTQFHKTHRSVQEVSNSSEVSVRSGITGRGAQLDERLVHASFNQEMTSGVENHNEEEEYYPKLSTKELAQHFEKAIVDAAPSKKKTEHHIHLSQLASDIKVSDQTFKTEISGTSLDTIGAAGAGAGYPGFVCDTDDEDLDYLPPPPPDLLEENSGDTDLPEPPEPKCAMKHTMNKEQYFKQRELLELKRLCKHIHPDVRKDLERDFYSEVNEIDEDEQVIGDVQDTTYHFEHTGSSPNRSPEREYLEWDEILRGEVQSMRWMFENKPLDCIKDSSDDEKDSRKIVQQELIAGGDVKNTALLFETQVMDTLELDNNYTSKKRSYNKISQNDVRAAAWLFETKPMDSLNKIHVDDEQTKEVVFTQEAARGNVKSMRYMFENPEMDSGGDTETMDEKHLLTLKSVMEEIKADVKIIVWMFETQCMCVLREHSGEVVEITSVRREETEKGDVKTSRWLFETQPLDMINKDLSHVRLISSISMEDSTQGDVKTGRWLFETKRLEFIHEQWERTHKQPKEQIIGADVRRHCMVFETQPMDTLKDESNSRPVTTEEIIGGDVRSVRHLFETGPLDELKELPEVGKLKKKEASEEERGNVRHQRWMLENQSLASIHTEENELSKVKKTMGTEEERGDVRHQKWLFETQKLEDIREEKKEVMKLVNIEQTDEESCKGDVRRNCWVFETQPMDTLKDDSNARLVNTEEIIGGDVQSARHFFEAAPKDELKELAEVGKLKRKVTAEEEKGDVRHQKWVFESQPLEQIREVKKEISRTVNIEGVENVDVTNYKQIFETCDLSQYDESHRIQVEGVTKGSVKSNKDLFESTPMYAMQDSSGRYHEVKTVRREEIVKGDVKSCQWMFETRPIDQFDESISKFQVIKGITQQEVESGDVKTAKWLFETQPLDAIKYFSNIEDEECVSKDTAEIVKGDVKTCKWLFETKPMDALYEKVEFKSENETKEVQKGDVKTCTWLFETQALDTIRDESETVLKASTVKQEDIQGKDVRMARFLFETENLENITGEEGHAFKRVTEIDIQSGDVSQMKYIFETQSSDVMTSTSEEFMHQLKAAQAEDIQKGNVGGCKWLFETQPIDAIRDDPGEHKGARTVTDVQGGNVDKGRFIFETFSLDEIRDVTSLSEMKKLHKIICEEEEKGDVKNYAMMFETQPLYAIQDKEGHYHEVTTLTKEEILKGDVVGARWLFETKPLDSIRDTDEVYIIKAVTEEDIQKGDVSSARWKFETQPLDSIAEESKISVRTVEDIRGGDVQANKQRFESDLMSQKLVRTVSMSEIYKGDVRAAKWMFETHTMDQIHGEKSEDTMERVVMQEQVKGDVRQAVWLFEKNPLDHIKEKSEIKEAVREEIPKADVKTTTWLFETTPLPDFNEGNVEKTEIIGKSIKETLDELYSQKMVENKGIIIETDEIGDVHMAKYNLMNKKAPQIQKEEVIRGDLQNIMINLLNRKETKERGIVIDAEERGNIGNTVEQLFNQQATTNLEKEEITRGDIQAALNNLLKDESTGRCGILIQEDEKGDIRMTIYSLFNKQEVSTIEKENIIKGNVQECLQKLFNAGTGQLDKIKVDDAERGNVRFYSTCIESGALDYLKQLQVDPQEIETNTIEKEDIVCGDIKGTKLSLTCNQAQICRLVDTEDIVPGDVHNTVNFFMTEPTFLLTNLKKEEIVSGDLRATLNSLTQSINQPVVLEKEEVVKGDIPTALKSLEEAQRQPKEVEKPQIVPGNIKEALKSLKDSANTKNEIVIEDLVPGDIKGTLKSLEEAKQAVKEVEKEEIVKGDIHTTLQNLHDASNERKDLKHEIDIQGDIKGTIQLLLEPSSPRMQRRASTEGDVKMSIKTLYETQEQLQVEKEEVIKGDVKGTIKSLLETAQKASPKITRREPIRKVKVPKVKPTSVTQQEIQATSVKNLTKSPDTRRKVQKLVTSKSMQSVSTSQEKNTESHVSKTDVLEHKTIVQTHGVKTLKTEFRNLKTSNKQMIKLDKSKERQKIIVPPISTISPLPDSDFPLPPSPSPDYDSLLFPPPPPPIRGDNDLPPPPTPPPPPPLNEPVKSDLDHLPPPPTPPPLQSTEQEFLPPPPSQQELDLIPNMTPVKPTKLKVKPVKAPALCKVPKLEPAVQFSKTDMHGQTTTQVTESSKTVEKISKVQSQCTVSSVSSSLISSEIQSTFSMQAPESPRPPKKVFVPVSLTPPASPPPSKSPISKFKTPLIKAEQKFRKQQEESYTPPSSPAFEIHMDESVSSVLKLPSSEGKSTMQSEQGISFDFTQEKGEKTVTKDKSATESYDSSMPSTLLDVPPSKPLISPTNEKSPSQSAVISSAKQHIISNQTSQATSVQQQTTSNTSKKKKKYRSMTTSIQQVTSTTVTQTQVSSSMAQMSANVQTFSSEDQKAVSKNITACNEFEIEAVKKDIANMEMTDKTGESKKVEISANKDQGNGSPDRTKPGKTNPEGKSKETEPKVQKADSQKAKKGNRNNKDDSTEKKSADQAQGVKVAQQSVQLRDSREINLTETEIKVEKQTKSKQVEEAPATPKKKRRGKNKKDKEIAQHAQGQTQTTALVVPVSLSEVKQPFEISNQKQEEIAVAHTHKTTQEENGDEHTEVSIPEIKVEQSLQQHSDSVKPEKQVDASPERKEEVDSHQITDELKEESKYMKIKHYTESSDQNQEDITVEQLYKTAQEENGDVHKEVSIPESKVEQRLQQHSDNEKTKKQVNTSLQKQEQEGSHQISEKSEEESRNVPINVTWKIAQKESVMPSAGSAETSERCAEVQKLLSHIAELQEAGGKMDSKSVKTLLNEIPQWLIGPEDKNDLEETAVEHNMQKLKEIVDYVQSLVEAKVVLLEEKATAIEKHECEATSEKMISGGATQRISKITIGSKKLESHKKEEEKKSTHKGGKQQEKSIKTADPREPSPLLRRRSPSPTFITIESTRRAESPQTVAPSPPPPPPTPPPRRSETPTSRLSRASPSPTLGRASSLTRLREATAKLSRQSSPDVVPRSVPATGMKSEIVETPATFHRQIKIDSMLAVEATFLEGNKETSSGKSVSEGVTTSIRDERESFEEAQKDEGNRTSVQKDPISVPECLGLDVAKAETQLQEIEKETVSKSVLSGVVNKFETLEEKVDVGKGPIDIPEPLGSATEDSEPNTQKKASQQEDMPAFNIKVIKNVFEMGEQSSSIKEQKNKQEEQVSSMSEIASEGSKHEPQLTTPPSSQQTSPLPLRKEVSLEESVDSDGFSTTQTITEHYSTADEFGTEISGTRSTTTISEHSESVLSQCAPFSYADAVKKKTPEVKASPEASAEELLKNFHQTWTESESVFKSLGYCLSGERLKPASRVPKSEMCTICRKRVYPMEGLIVDKKKFHKSCFSCEHCKNKLSLGNYVSLNGHLFCPPHYKQLFKTKGNFDDGFEKGPQKELLTARNLRNNNSEGLDWRYSISQSSVSSISDMFDKEASKLYEKSEQIPQSLNKISLVWPPQNESPKKAFAMEQDIHIVKPAWPPKNDSSRSPKRQQQKVPRRTTF